MAGNIKGMTIEIGGNTAPLEQALKDVNKDLNSTQKELNQVNKLLKLDPTNTTLLKQKQELLGDQIKNTTTKLDALKQAQKQLDETMKNGGEVNQKEYRELERQIAMSESSLKKLKDEAKACNPQLAQLKEGLKKIGDVAGKGLQASIDLTVNGIKAMATASISAVTSLGALAIKAGAMADDLNTLSATTGLTTKQLQQFSYASDLIDVSTETLSGSLKKLTSSMNSAERGTGTQAEAFEKLGVNIKNVDGSLRSNSDVFNDTIRALGNIANETERDAMAMQIFGKSATELNPLIKGGIDTLDEMGKQADKLGLILSQDALDGANAFNDQIDILKANGRGLFNVIGTEIASSLVPAMEQLNEYSMEVIQNLTTALREGGIEGLVNEVSNQLGQAIPKVLELLPKVADIGVQLVNTLINSLSANGGGIGSTGAELVTKLIEGFYSILPTFVNLATQIITGFVAKLGENMPDIITAVVEGFINVADVLIENIDIILDAVVKIAVGIVEGIDKALPLILDALPDALQKIATALVDNLPLLLDAVGKILTGIGKILLKVLDWLGTPILKALGSIAGAIISGIGTLFDAVTDLGVQIGQFIVDNVHLITDRFVEFMSKIASALLEKAKRLYDDAKQILEYLGQGIMNAVSIITGYIKKLWNQMENAFLDAFSAIVEVGTYIIQGLWNGMKNAKDWLIGKIKSLCTDALGAIKDFFGIESPSKVMANEVGNFLAKGIGVGFEKTMPSVIDQMKESLSNVTNAFQTELSFGDIPQIQGNQIISENQYITRNYNNTVETLRQPTNIELILDGTKVARALIPPLDNEYNRLGVRV